MLASYWRKYGKLIGLTVGAFVGALIVLFAGIYVGQNLGHYGAQADGYAAEYPSDTDERIERCFQNTDLSSAKQCAQEAIEAGREHQRDEQDLQAQREMADWAFGLLILTAAQMPLGIAGLVALIVTIMQGRDANQIAREAVETENRAWLTAKISGNELRVMSDWLIVHAAMQIENVGNLPAQKVAWVSDFIMTDHPVEEPDFEKILDAKESEVATKNEIGFAVFPRQTPVFKLASDAIDDIQPVIKHGGMKYLYLAIRLTYVSGGVRCHTDYYFNVQNPNAGVLAYRAMDAAQFGATEMVLDQIDGGTVT